jgi:hypothetical protein
MIILHCRMAQAPTVMSAHKNCVLCSSQVHSPRDPGFSSSALKLELNMEMLLIMIQRQHITIAEQACALPASTERHPKVCYAAREYNSHLSGCKLGAWVLSLMECSPKHTALLERHINNSQLYN